MREELDNVASSIEGAKEFNADLSEFLDKNLVIEGKTLRQWRKHFHVSFPEDINFSTLIQKSLEICKKHQEAAFYRDKENTQLAILEQAKINKYNSAYNQVRREHQETYGKRLAADSCKAAALLEIKDIEEALSNQKIVSEFWHKTCILLSEVRKHLELIGYALSGDARIQRDFVVKEGKENKGS